MIATAQANYPQLSLRRLCALLGVNRAWYYAHQRQDLAAEAEATRLRDAVERLVLAFPGYGYRRVTKALQRDGWTVNHKRVLRIMREEALLCQLKRRFVATTDARHDLPTYPNLLSGLAITRLDQVWVADITYIRLPTTFIYLACIGSYYTFYLIEKFQVSVQSAQIHLFFFLGAIAAGTLLGGIVGDRIGRKYVIWFSILGMLPFTLMLPYANLFWVGVLATIIGLILASAFPAIVVYAQELLPGRVGMIAGLFFGLSFGLSGIGAAVLGAVADETSIDYVFKLCAFLPAIGLLTVFLPNFKAYKR